MLVSSILKMQESGTSKRVFRAYEDIRFENVGCRTFIKTGPTYQENLGMSYLGSLFITLAVFYTVAILIYVAEYLYLKLINLF